MMKMGDLGMAGGLAVAALAFTLSAAPAAAQGTDDCRCVDRDGNAIENCSCFRAPDVRAFVAPLWQSDERPRLGISVDANQSARRDADGALVTDVLEGGPADEAGIRRGDVITAIDGHSLFEPLAADAEEGFDLDQSVPVQRLLAMARELEPGEEVAVEYVRDGETHTTTVEAEELSDEWGGFGVARPRLESSRLREQLRGLTGDMRFRFRDRTEAPVAPEARDDLWEYSFGPRAPGRVRVFGGGDGAAVLIDRYRGVMNGLELVALNPQLGAYFGAERGVLVADVHEDSTLGLEPGDVVLRIGDRQVDTPDRMRRILQSYGDDEEVTLVIRRDGRETTVTGRVGG